MLNNLPPLGDLARIVAQRLYADRCLQIASSLTFTTLLAIVPLITVALTVISAFPVFAALTEHVQQFVLENMVPESADTIAAYTDQFAANAAKLTAVGIAILTVTAIMLMMTIDHAFNDIWRVAHRRSVFQRVIVYWTLLTVGPLLIGASLSLTSWLVSLSLGLVSDVPGAGLVLLKIVPVVLTAAALAMLYLAMPNRRIAVKDALAGGVLAGLAFEATKRGFVFYVSQFPAYKLVYGAFATVPLFLLWIYLSWLVVLFGAVVVAALPEWRERVRQQRAMPGAEFFDALQVLKILWQAQQQGEAVGLKRLHGAVRAPTERIEAILDAMVGAGWVSRVVPPGWVLNRDPDAIKVEEVYRLFVFRAEARVPTLESDPELEALVHEISARIAEHMQMSIAELFRSAVRTEMPVAPARTQPQ